MPGMNNYISVKNSDGKREHVQKRLLLCNMNGLYSQFVQEYSDKKIGISKFTQLRPKHCVIAGSSGTHVSHAFIPTFDGLLMFKKYSLASEYNIFPKKKRAPKEASQITKRRKTPAKKNSQTKPKTAKRPQIKQKPVKCLPIKKVVKKSKAKR
ncbi:hypothetical protein QAD02_020319 [Eretmocerus hayati]|uniref:Uncharacterized protein n=1 Tax=Eretmocerus hayati TaxID=131215 RepID=A0ACC2PM58_9HYME|nr:hypothetical protein QAD02_020319 [Eretmocerus hayati]